MPSLSLASSDDIMVQHNKPDGSASHAANSLSANKVPDNCPEVMQIALGDYDLSSLKQRETLESGGALLSFSCTHTLDSSQQEMVLRVTNLTSFEDEVLDNNVPLYEPDQDSYTFLLVMTAYILPFPNFLEWITPARLASTEYQTNCQVSSTQFWEQTEDDTFRFTKPIIPHIFYMTVQFKVTELPRKALDSLSDVIGGAFIERGLLLERTKRNKQKPPDRCRKAKCVLLFTRVDGGILCHNLTVILQSSIPSIIAQLVTHFGALGENETLETVQNTRRYLRATLP